MSLSKDKKLLTTQIGHALMNTKARAQKLLNYVQIDFVLDIMNRLFITL